MYDKLTNRVDGKRRLFLFSQDPVLDEALEKFTELAAQEFPVEQALFHVSSQEPLFATGR
jgi:hypothetical protein